MSSPSLVLHLFPEAVDGDRRGNYGASSDHFEGEGSDGGGCDAYVEGSTGNGHSDTNGDGPDAGDLNRPDETSPLPVRRDIRGAFMPMRVRDCTLVLHLSLGVMRSITQFFNLLPLNP